MHPALSSHPFQTVWAHWSSLRTGTDLPAKRDLNPAALKTVLPNVVLLERAATDRFVYRLAGTAFAERLSYNPTGQNLIDQLDPAVRDWSITWFNRSLDERFGALSEYSAEYYTGRVNKVASLYLPLRDATGAVSLFLAVNWPLEMLSYKPAGAVSRIGTDLLTVEPLDLGFGVPDLPRTPERPGVGRGSGPDADTVYSDSHAQR
ncbi:hypothetical protein EV659_106154 [Rhodothalassium salexigens DSM 2132]|uniref:PAS domain-containing protein n=1 Tax=Rhodothalassium salexigens DSM 2132 TaxID=1188247 RepID=A0A4R2PJ75_RHOSA|nr:PAS domain-containing protein [Rhodothalassium salexigens]MBB4211707.1 hypothetical protein [Rhodothalassium salexigens DSM 2132]TCP33995.1 hypothetical protein EV659_106154 [Rhodothalassium salexigens DSM 2132]